MSLLEEAMESCTLLVRSVSADGYGGYVTEWKDGGEFECAVVCDNSLEARVAEKQGVSSVYTVITPRSLTLMYHDVFRRASDKKVFRVTSDGDDKKTPESAGLDMRACAAEEWELPNG